MAQVLQIVGALLILVAFAASQWGLITTSSRPYLVLNLLGSLTLALLAAHERQLGFLFLETVWALVSGWALIPRLSRG